MERETHKEIFRILSNARKPVLVSDRGIDGDSLGSSLAVAAWLKERGVHAPVYVSGPVPERYLGLPLIRHCTEDLSVFDDPDIDAFVTFDCSDAGFVRTLTDRLSGNPPIINIDHHKTNPRFGTVNQVLVGSPATAIVVHRFFKENGITPSPDAATLLLTGICFDTGIFLNQSTTAEAFDVAGELILRGVRVRDVIRTLYANRSVAALRLWGTALERLNEHGSFVSTAVTRADLEPEGVAEDDMDGLSNFLSLVIDADTVVVLRETFAGGVKASMRTCTRDVSRVAAHFGGGGHAKAAGFVLHGASLRRTDGGFEIEGHPDAYAKIEELLNETV